MGSATVEVAARDDDGEPVHGPGQLRGGGPGRAPDQLRRRPGKFFIFIVAELLYTLRLVNLGERILVELFLFIGLIAVVRKVLVVTAEFAGSRRAAVDFVIQIGGLAALALVLAIAIRLLRSTNPTVDAATGG